MILMNFVNACARGGDPGTAAASLTPGGRPGGHAAAVHPGSLPAGYGPAAARQDAADLPADSLPAHSHMPALQVSQPFQLILSIHDRNACAAGRHNATLVPKGSLWLLP